METQHISKPIGTKRVLKPKKRAVIAPKPPERVFGEPERPSKLPRPVRRAWNDLVAELLAARKLYTSDGPLLLELIQARADSYKGHGQRREAARQRLAELPAKFDSRSPAPESAPEPNSENEL